MIAFPCRSRTLEAKPEPLDISKTFWKELWRKSGFSDSIKDSVMALAEKKLL